MVMNCLGCTADDLFCDVIDQGYRSRCNRLAEKIEKLSPEEQSRIFAAADTSVGSMEKQAKNNMPTAAPMLRRTVGFTVCTDLAGRESFI